MKLVTYTNQEKKWMGDGIPPKKEPLAPLEGRTGIVENGQVIDCLEAFRWLSSQSGSSSGNAALTSCQDMLAIIRNWDRVFPIFQIILQAFRESKLPKTLIQAESKCLLLSPLPQPVSMRDGYAFRQHVETARKNRGLPMIPEFDSFPVFYFTNHLAVTGPGDVPVQKLARNHLDFELEVAIVIGRTGRNIKASEADSYIFGFLIMNDWSARTLQMEEMKLNLGPAKGKDFATSLGPYLVTRDEIEGSAVKNNRGTLFNLGMKAFVNGKQLSTGNLKDMNWTFAQIIERASYGVTLYPGEVIGSGTVGTGCLLELNGSKVTDNLWLNPGDEVVLEVEKLGRLVNRIVLPPEEDL